MTDNFWYYNLVEKKLKNKENEYANQFRDLFDEIKILCKEYLENDLDDLNREYKNINKIDNKIIYTVLVSKPIEELIPNDYLYLLSECIIRIYEKENSIYPEIFITLK